MATNNVDRLLNDLRKEYGVTPSVEKQTFKVVNTANGNKYETIGIKIHLDFTPVQSNRTVHQQDYYRLLIISLVLDKYPSESDYHPTRLLTILWSEKILSEGGYVVGKPIVTNYNSTNPNHNPNLTIKKSRMKWKHESGFVIFSNGIWGNQIYHYPDEEDITEEGKREYLEYKKTALKVSTEPTNLRNIKASLPLIEILIRNNVYLEDVERLREDTHKITRMGVQLGIITDHQFTNPYSM